MSHQDLALILNEIVIEGYEDVDWKQVDLKLVEWWSFKFKVLNSIRKGKSQKREEKKCKGVGVSLGLAFVFGILTLVELIVIIECYRRKKNMVMGTPTEALKRKSNEPSPTVPRVNSVPPLNFPWQNQQSIPTREQTPLDVFKPLHLQNKPSAGMIEPLKDKNSLLSVDSKSTPPVDKNSTLKENEGQIMKVDIATINYQPVQHIYRPVQTANIQEYRPLFGMPGAPTQEQHTDEDKHKWKDVQLEEIDLID